MPHYRLYHFSPSSNQIIGLEEFQMDDDQTALRRASDRLDILPLELWKQERLIARLEPSAQRPLASRKRRVSGGAKRQ